MTKFVTSHPLEVSADNVDLAGCPSESCKLWGSGVLELTSGLRANSSRVILTLVGCETCYLETFSNGDMGRVLDISIQFDRQEDLTDAVLQAHETLAKTVQEYAPATNPQLTS